MDDPPRRKRRRHSDRARRRRLVYEGLRFAARQVSSIYTALGLLIVAGALLAFAGTWAFAALAEEMREGTVQPFDDAVMRWASEHRLPWLETFLIELTVLGDWIVVIVVVGVAALFLSLARRRWSVILLLVANVGGILITHLLKLGFARPRPQFFDWGDPVITASFPSGHASSAAVAYGTIAYLIARLHHRAIVRRSILVAAAVLIALIALSRIYIGVHYPSDVLAGLTLGIAWAAFCMAALEATQKYLERRTSRHRRSTDAEPELEPGSGPQPEPPVPAQAETSGAG
jgi:undecaprenyl-diphosphatase